MKALNVFLALAVSALIALVVFELGLRAIGKGPPASILEFDAHTGWRKKANVKAHRSGPEFSVTIATNEFGLADDPMPSAAKPQGTFRVVVLGDSFTQGFTVDRKDLWVDLVEQRWKAEGRGVEVVNAGTEGWSTDQEVAWLLENGAKFGPDLVVLATYENDLYWNGQAHYIDRNSAKPLFRADGTLESGTLEDIGPRPWCDNLATGRFFKGILGALSPPDYVLAHVFRAPGARAPMLKEFAAVLNDEPDFMARSLDGTLGALRALDAKCKELGARAVVVTIPSHSAIDPEFKGIFAKSALGGLPADAWSPDKPVDTFLKLSDEVGLPALDVRSALRSARESTHDALYFAKDWHLDPAGNRVLANAVHDELDRRGLLPAAKSAVASDPIVASGASSRPKWPFVFAGLWFALTALYAATYRDDRNWRAPLKVGAMLALVFVIMLGGGELVKLIPPPWSTWIGALFVIGVLGFVIYKLGRRVATILELFKSFVLRGHWYLMPLLVVLLTVGSLLVVAASSPLIAPFIYTLF